MNKYQKALNTIVDAMRDYVAYREFDSLLSENEIYAAMALLRKLVNKEDSFEWIPFNCELPDVYEKILVSDGDSVWQDGWWKSNEGYELYSGIELEDFAWMPLPKPYKEKENERY